MKEIQVGSNVIIANNRPLTLIAGPCAIQSLEHALFTAGKLKGIAEEAGLPFIYKSSFDKANRSSGSSFRGVGMAEGLAILREVRQEYNIPVLTDIHLPEQAAIVADVVDVLQIPAFLCRQTDLIVAAARTGKPVNIKKGQFMAPVDMRPIMEKAAAAGNEQVLLCERGTFFGYHDLVVDMRSLAIMKEFGGPVVFDATHSVQSPGGLGTCSGGQRQFVFPLACSAVSQGIAAIFMETHEDPDHAPCDGPNMIPIDELPQILSVIKKLDNIAKECS